MSDRYYGSVQFPSWAVKHFPGSIAKDLAGKLDQWGDDPLVMVFEDSEALDGIPWLVEDLIKLGIPYDMSSAEYFECPAVNNWFRFCDDGRTITREVNEKESLIPIADVLSLIKKGDSLSDIEKRLEADLQETMPLYPPLWLITEEQWQKYRVNANALTNSA